MLLMQSIQAFRTPHSLVHLFPQFLRKRRVGYPGIQALLAETNIPRPALFLLFSLAIFPPEGATAEELRPGTPYSTRDPHLPLLDDAQARGLIAHDQHGRYQLTEQGMALVIQAEQGATDWLAQQEPLPASDLRRLADEFGAIADGLARHEWGPDAHVHRWGRLAALAPDRANAPLVRLERAIMDLWMARDDAHMAAWHSARFHGPQVDVLTRLWRGDAEDLATLQSQMADTQDPETVAATVDELTEQGYLEVRLGTLQPSRAGYNVREEIESATDEIYFHQWPDLDSATIAWLHDALTRLIAALPGVPPAR
jgi:hypothetical protein